MSTTPIQDRLREEATRARERAGLSRPELAAMLGMSRQGVWQRETGKDGTSIDQWVAHLGALGVGVRVDIVRGRAASVTCPEERAAGLAQLASCDDETWSLVAGLLGALEVMTERERKHLAVEFSLYVDKAGAV